MRMLCEQQLRERALRKLGARIRRKLPGFRRASDAAPLRTETQSTTGVEVDHLTWLVRSTYEESIASQAAASLASRWSPGARLRRLSASLAAAARGRRPEADPEAVARKEPGARTEPVRFMVKEVGGAMSPVWPKYYGAASAILFVVDASRPERAADACAELYRALSAPELPPETPVVVALNKIDAPSRDVPTAAVRRALRLGDLSRASAARGRRIVVLGNVSGRRGDRLPRLLDELARLHARAASAARDRGEPSPLP